MPALYIHIPFCQSRCIYCDFYSTTALHLRERYVRAVCQEIAGRGGGTASTIYLGGGTPSQLSPTLLTQIFDTIYQHFTIAETAEVTMEMNPDDVTEDYVQALRQLPVNRISLGIQTFNDERLHFLHRRHTANHAVQAVRILQNAGYGNLSIDLMFGFPEQTIGEWEADIKQALSLGVQHISAYSLMYEEGTVLTKMRDKGTVKEVDEEKSRKMYEILMSRLQQAGFEHYEISNFCLPGFHSRHNSSYWDGTPYLGFGAAAHSYDGNTRSWNPSNLPIYIKGIEEHINMEQNGGGSETLTTVQKYDERIMTGLRTAQGVNLKALREDFGEHFYQYCLSMAEKHIQRGLLEQKEKTILRLTKEGLFVSDDVMSDLMFA